MLMKAEEKNYINLIIVLYNICNYIYLIYFNYERFQLYSFVINEIQLYRYGTTFYNIISIKSNFRE